MEKKILDNYLLAGKIAAEVREESKAFVKVGVPVLEIAEKIEALIRKKGAEPAFPLNISLNEAAAHYTPSRIDDTKIQKSDLVKINSTVWFVANTEGEQR